MKYPLSFVLVLAFTLLAHSDAEFSLNRYNSSLPLWGTTWTPGQHAINGYYPTFYTGFAMRSQFPDRIHIRTARGNQTRVSVILDEKTLSDYPYDLVKRADFYHRVTKAQNGRSAPAIPATEKGAQAAPHLNSFQQVVNSPTYGIREFVKSGASTEAAAINGLALLKALNPGRVFDLKINLSTEFTRWRAQVRGQSLDTPLKVVLALNSLVFGRINFTAVPTAAQLQQLRIAQDADDSRFVSETLKLFKMVTGTKYEIQSVVNGQMQNAVQCADSNSCTLTYSEFTAIYPTGSAQATMTDSFGNRINQFATPGLWVFLSRASHDVDNIRNEPYYGWIPKMDFEGIGNGFHNPAVRFASVDPKVKTALNIPADHSTFWSVKRGGVSHGCLRLPAGHTWELRHILPVENEKMTRVHFFGNGSEEFDVYDINGDGAPEVMGVDYLISYGVQGADGLTRREGANLEIAKTKKLEFYKQLYGANGVFEITSDGRYVFDNPAISMPSHLDLRKKSVKARMKLQGQFPLYEQAYEQDKLQIYVPAKSGGPVLAASDPGFKSLIRLFGRVRGCAPSADKKQCGEQAFDQEAASILTNLNGNGN